MILLAHSSKLANLLQTAIRGPEPKANLGSHPPGFRVRQSAASLCKFLTLVAFIMLATFSARAELAFAGVAAGDATSTSAVLWRRALDINFPGAKLLTAQVATNSSFSGNVLSFGGSTDASKDYTAKILAIRLSPATRY